MKRCPIDKVDEGIRELVQLLWDEGLGTISSCQGGEGHPTSLTSVTIVPEDGESYIKLLVRVVQFIERHNVPWFHIGTHRTAEYPYILPQAERAIPCEHTCS